MNKKIVIPVVIVGLFLIIGGGVFLYSNNDNQKTKTTTVKDISINEKVLKKETKHDAIDSEEFIDEYDKAVAPKINIYDSILGEDYPIDDMSKISDLKKTLVLLNSVNSDGSKKKVSIKTLEKNKYKYFTSVNYYKETIKNDDLIVYKFKDNNYIYNMQYNDLNVFELESTFDEVYTDYVIISQKILFLESIIPEGSEIAKNTVYKDSQKKEKIYEFDGDVDLTEEIKNMLVDKLDTYLYRFDKYDDEYLLTSVTKK